MRTCKHCGGSKPENLEFFSFSKNSRKGLNSRCRECVKIIKREWYSKNKEKASEYRKSWYQKDRRRKYKISLFEGRPFYKKATYMREGMLSRSKEKGLNCDKDLFTVSYIENWLKANPNCECCGKQLNINSNKLEHLSPSIDRILPEKGYVDGNLALLCWRCNNLKRDSNPVELQMIVNWMKSEQ